MLQEEFAETSFYRKTVDRRKESPYYFIVTATKTQNWNEALLLFVICFLPFFRGIRFVTFLALQDVLVLTVVIWIFLAKFSFYKKYIPAFALTFLVTGVLILQTFIVSDDTFHSTVNILKCLNCYLFLPLVLLYLSRLENAYQFGVSGFIFGAIFSSLVSILGVNGLLVSSSRVSGYAGDPVMYSILLSFALCYLISNDASILKWTIASRLVAILLISIEILRTGSGSGIAITGLGVFITRVFFRAQSMRRKTSFMDFGIVMILWIVWKSDFANTTKERIQIILNPKTSYSMSTSSGHSTIESRILSIKHAFVMIRERPILGRGFSLNAQLTDLGIQPHNYFVLAWLTGGLLLLSCTLLFLCFNLKLMLISLRYRDSIVIITQIATFFALMSEPILWDCGFFTALMLLLVKNRKLNQGNLIIKKLH